MQILNLKYETKLFLLLILLPVLGTVSNSRAQKTVVRVAELLAALLMDSHSVAYLEYLECVKGGAQRVRGTKVPQWGPFDPVGSPGS